MPNLIISYKFDDEINPDEVRNWYEITGSICVKYENVIITKSCAEGDDGYLGNWIFEEIMEFVDSIPLLASGVKCEIEILEDFMGFSMEPKNGLIYFAVIPMDLEEEIAEEILKTYPCGLEGCPIPSKIFLNGVYEMGCRFIDDVMNKYKNLCSSEVESFRIKLKLARDAMNEYNKEHGCPPAYWLEKGTPNLGEIRIIHIDERRTKPAQKSITTFWPMGYKVRINAPTTPNNMNMDDLHKMIRDSIEHGSMKQKVDRFGNVKLFIFEWTLDNEQFGVKKVKTIVAPNGNIITSYPVEGSSVLRYSDKYQKVI